MVQGVGGTGSGGSLTDLSVYQTYRPMYDEYKRENPNTTFTFEGWLTWKGYHKNFNQKAENYIETGKESVGDGKDQNNIGNKFVTNGEQAIYQTQDDDCYYEFDYENGTYRKIEGKQDVANALGIGDVNFDTINFGHNKVNVTDYTFGGLSDGQDKTISGVNGSRYGNITYTDQEFDIDYILNALLMDPSDPQYGIAKGIYEDLCSNINQWLNPTDMEALDEVAKEYGTDSAEYKAKLKEVLLANLDQAQEWVDDHTHVKKSDSTTLNPWETDKDDTTTDGTKPGEDSNSTSKIPGSYDRQDILYNTSAYGDYTANKSSSTSSYGSKSDTIKEGISNFTAEAQAKLAEVGTALKAKLQAQMGDDYDEAAVDAYIKKAIIETINHFTSDIPTLSKDYGDDGNYHTRDSDFTLTFARRKNNAGRITYNVKNLIDYFFGQFDTLCANNGKSAAEVEAEKKAAEEKAAREKEAYKTLNNMDMKSVAKEAGVDPNKDPQVINASSAADIKAKAESDILTPLKNKIKEKMKGQSISDADLNTILDNAANAALENCTDWATTGNNVVYTIDTSKLIETFNANVKTVIKNKGVEL